VKADFAFRGLSLEIRGNIADLQRHDLPPLPLGFNRLTAFNAVASSAVIFNAPVVLFI
jgi:hypothetical protein